MREWNRKWKLAFGIWGWDLGWENGQWIPKVELVSDPTFPTYMSKIE